MQFADENDTIHFKPIWDDTGRQRYVNRPASDKWCPGYGMIGRMRRVMDEGLKFSGRYWVTSLPRPPHLPSSAPHAR